MKKRIIALLLAMLCCVTLLAGCGEDGTQQDTAGKQDGSDVVYITPDLGGVKLNVYMGTDTDFDPEGSYVDTIVEEHLNMDLTYWETSAKEAIQAAVAQGTAPDMIRITGYTHESWGVYGAEDELFVNIMDCLGSMPNLKAYLEDPANAEVLEKFTYSDGEMYAVPVLNSGSAAIYAYLYRQDIFQKHNLTFPTNQEEFVEVLRKLKELYPESEPFAMRSMKKNIQAAQLYGHLWGASHINQSGGKMFTLDAEGNYYLGQTSQAYKEIAQFWKELMDEGLMNKNSLNMDTDGWYAAFRSGKSFITYDKVDRLTLMNQNGQTDDPEFQVVAGAPFNMGSYAETTDVVSTSFAEGITSRAIMIGNGENMGEALSYVDWLYSPEGRQMTSWGIEGESYQVAKDGTKTFKEGFVESQGGWLATGLCSVVTCGVTDFEAYKVACEPYLAEAITLAEQFAGRSPKQPLLSFTEDEELMYKTYASGLHNYVCGEWYKFVSGQRDFSEWDQVLERAKKVYGYDILLKIHQDAYARLQGEEK